MFKSAKLKLDRAQHHIADLERQFKSFVERKPHRFSIKHYQETGQPVIQIRFVEHVPDSFSVIIGDAIHNLSCALDHTMWELMGWDGGTQDRHTKFPARDNRTNFDAACNGIRTPSEWVRQMFISFEVFPEGEGRILYIINSFDNHDKHHVIAPVLRATTHPPFQIFHQNGVPFLRMEGNRFIGGISDDIEIANVPAGGYIELDDTANCEPSIFMNGISDADAFEALRIFSAKVRDTIAEIEQKISENPKK